MQNRQSMVQSGPSRVLLVALLCAVSACGQKPEDASRTSRALPVTISPAIVQEMEVIESTVGTLEAVTVPTVAAETSGRVVKILRDVGASVPAGEILAVLDSELRRAELDGARAVVQRVQALGENQDLTVRRLQDLAKRQSVSQNMLDDALAQQRALRAQLLEAQARLAEAERALRMTEIRAPGDAVIQRRIVSVGSYVSVGDPVFELVAPNLMRALLPFPESVSSTLRVGQTVRLESPLLDDRELEARLTELRPMVGANNRSIEAIATFANPGGWRAGSSVTARVVIEAREGIAVPTAAVVERPAGTVVYVVENEVARQRAVRTGIRKAGVTEIREGLHEGESMVVDGAGFLTDGTPVTIRTQQE